MKSQYWLAGIWRRYFRKDFGQPPFPFIQELCGKFLANPCRLVTDMRIFTISPAKLGPHWKRLNRSLQKNRRPHSGLTSCSGGHWYPEDEGGALKSAKLSGRWALVHGFGALSAARAVNLEFSCFLMS
jgi:hypothetical protein